MWTEELDSGWSVEDLRYLDRKAFARWLDDVYGIWSRIPVRAVSASTIDKACRHRHYCVRKVSEDLLRAAEENPSDERLNALVEPCDLFWKPVACYRWKDGEEEILIAPDRVLEFYDLIDRYSLLAAFAFDSRYRKEDLGFLPSGKKVPLPGMIDVWGYLLRHEIFHAIMHADRTLQPWEDAVEEALANYGALAGVRMRFLPRRIPDEDLALFRTVYRLHTGEDIPKPAALALAWKEYKTKGESETLPWTRENWARIVIEAARGVQA